MSSSKSEVTGTQSIQRAIEILRVLAANNFSDGVRFADLENITSLSKGTLYRILSVLKQAGLVEQHPGTRLYCLGMDFLSLGSLSTNRFNMRESARSCLTRLAAKTQDTVFLQLPTGTDVVCVDRIDGEFPIKAHSLNIGGRRPLGMGASSIALLSLMKDSEICAILERNARRFRNYKLFDTKTVIEKVRLARKEGYAYDNGTVVRQIHAISMPFGGTGGVPVATITVAAIPERFTPVRRREIVDALKKEIGKLLNALVSFN